MWHWEQGRLAYFQFDVLRRVSAFAMRTNADLVVASRSAMKAATDMPFDPAGYTPWRNYQRVFRQMMIVAGRDSEARPTPVARMLAEPGLVTADEYFHFVAQATTEPSPALSGYEATTAPRFPLLFSLKYLLCKAAINLSEPTPFDEIIGAYLISGFRGDETDEAFISLLARRHVYSAKARAANDKLRRQARESLRVMAQISYLHVDRQDMFVSLAQADAIAAFAELAPVGGAREADPGDEIMRRAGYFEGGSTLDFFDYPATVVSDVVAAGFQEGSRVERTHLVVERNAQLRVEYFALFDPVACDMCRLDTRRGYAWTERVLDLHHILPLASGTRVERDGTVFSDLVPVCPTCHRAVHRFYGSWLKEQNRRDFESAEEALSAYERAKGMFGGHHLV